LVQIKKLNSKTSILSYFFLILSPRFAFVTFETEADCAAALKAHTQIAGDKVSVSHAFAKQPKSEKAATSPAPNRNHPQNSPSKPGKIQLLNIFSFILVFFLSRQRKRSQHRLRRSIT